ncbi:MAG TPA: HDIG domain-containing protein [Bacteroidota bacterium]|nr:HDIG domain-containing protein [Bacteroidota bacterium]
MKAETENISLLERLAPGLRIDRLKSSPIVQILIAAALVILVVLMFPHPESIEYNYSLGGIWADKDMIAPFSFPILKDVQQYERERQEAARGVYPVFDRHEEIERADLDSLPAIARNLGNAVTARIRWRKTRSQQDSLDFESAAARLPFPLSENEWRDLIQWSLAEKGGPAEASSNLGRILMKSAAEALRIGILDQQKTHRLRSYVSVRKGVMEEVLPYERVYDPADAAAAAIAKSDLPPGAKGFPSIASKIMRAALRPNLVYNSLETNREIDEAQDNVPRSIGFVQENERIIGRHDRITEENKQKLDSFEKAKIERGAEATDWKHWVGIFLHVVLVVGLFGIYLYLFRKRIYEDNAKLTLIGLIILMETFFAYLTSAANLSEPVDYLIFVPAASMLFAIIFDSRVAFYGTVTIAFLIAGIKGNDYAVALTSLFAGALGAYTVRDIRNRTQIFRSLMFIFLGYSLSIVALSFERNENFNAILTSLTYAMANSIFSPVLTYGLLIFFERVFRVTTDLTLLELSDFNQPLLRQLAEKAPGTFHHSMLLGTLAEAAADSIGANSILARVGAYYHDIGKMLKPEYFVENQVGPVNRHNRLKPRMSARIIASHVTEGVELGREWGLPAKILDFIPQHHGTTLISYFYDKALHQAARKNAKETVAEQDYRYPGPKPQSKEAGIVMLADSVEASTRALTEVTPQSLESAIQNMIKQRFAEGQLDYCELTLRDLTRIKDAFLKILFGIHHQRIQYPEQREEAGLRKADPARRDAPPAFVSAPSRPGPVLRDEAGQAGTGRADSTPADPGELEAIPDGPALRDTAGIPDDEAGESTEPPNPDKPE